MRSYSFTRRAAARKLAALLAGSPLAAAEREAPLDEVVNLFEIEDAARYRLSRQVYDAIAAGSGAGVTVRRNRQAFDRITLRPRVLVDVRPMDLSTRLLGQRMEVPILAAPLSNQTLAHPEGELATLRGAAAAKATVVLSSRPGVGWDRIATQAKGAAFWCQLEPPADQAGLREHVRKMVDAGAQALCVSAGWPPASGRKDPGAPPLDWGMIGRLREWTQTPVLIKGIMAPEEARAAVEKGAQGIIVSNYGGRFADGGPATIEVLPAIVDAVGDRAPVLVDSGFRRGTDVLKALALGARAILIGRPILWGLGAYGAEGVQKVVELLQTELALAMGLSGKPNLGSVDRTLVKIHRS
jgi:4-hydroxymandelate oxidase